MSDRTSRTLLLNTTKKSKAPTPQLPFAPTKAIAWNLLGFARCIALKPCRLNLIH